MEKNLDNLVIANIFFYQPAGPPLYQDSTVMFLSSLEHYSLFLSFMYFFDIKTEKALYQASFSNWFVWLNLGSLVKDMPLTLHTRVERMLNIKNRNGRNWRDVALAYGFRADELRQEGGEIKTGLFDTMIGLFFFIFIFLFIYLFIF